MGDVKCVYIALASPKCKNCCADGASPDAKYMERMLLCVADNELCVAGNELCVAGNEDATYMACGMQRVAKMLMSFEEKG